MEEYLGKGTITGEGKETRGREGDKGKGRRQGRFQGRKGRTFLLGHSGQGI